MTAHGVAASGKVQTSDMGGEAETNRTLVVNVILCLIIHVCVLFRLNDTNTHITHILLLFRLAMFNKFATYFHILRSITI